MGKDRKAKVEEKEKKMYHKCYTSEEQLEVIIISISSSSVSG
jgi:hypothetical protein